MSRRFGWEFHGCKNCRVVCQAQLLQILALEVQRDGFPNINYQLIQASLPQ